ncbi:MAG: sulfite exporter TauE/SafE family protein [Dehalococcoidia bacterium]|nr:sulfite exporter TauE/SafE family protein [Dehalococcoidia bacterium]
MDLLYLILMGLATGAAGGMLGIGGSVVLIPALTFVFGADQHRYQAAAMIVNFFVAAPAVVQHHRAGALAPRTVLRIVPLAIAGVIVGVLAGESSIFAEERESNLRLLFGLFLVAVCLYEFYRLFAREQEPHGPTSPPGWGFAACVSIPTGCVAGLLGVGGGIVAVPLQRRLLHTPTRTAIANSAAIIIATSLVGAALKNYAYLREHPGTMTTFTLALAVTPGAILGSIIGSRLTHRLPIAIVKGAFLIVLAIAGARLAADAGRATANEASPASVPPST